MAKLDKSLESAIITVDKFNESVTALSMDELAKAPKIESEPQVLQSQREIAKDDGIWLKPERRINSKEPFNEKFRTEYNFKSEYVPFIAENKEIIGEAIETWTKKFPGVSAEFWKVPTNKKVWGPRYLAEQISSKSYTRLVMEDRPTDVSADYAFSGAMVAKNKIQRLDARPAKATRQVAMMSDF